MCFKKIISGNRFGGDIPKATPPASALTRLRRDKAKIDFLESDKVKSPSEKASDVMGFDYEE